MISYKKKCCWIKYLSCTASTIICTILSWIVYQCFTFIYNQLLNFNKSRRLSEIMMVRPSRVSFFSRLPADRDKSAWFPAEISCEIAVRIRLSYGIYYNNLLNKLCLLIFRWLQTNIMASRAPTIENPVGKGSLFPLKLK